MKTTVITTALLALMFAGCSKDETKDLAPATQTTESNIRRNDVDVSGLYSVLKYSKEGVDAFDEMKDLKIYLYRDGRVVRTVVGSENFKGEYKYDSASKQISFSIEGNEQTNTLGSHVWQVTRLDGDRLLLNSTEDKLSLTVHKHNPLIANPVPVR